MSFLSFLEKKKTGRYTSRVADQNYEVDGNFLWKPHRRNLHGLLCYLKIFALFALQVLAKQQALQQQQMSALQTAAQRQRALALMCRYCTIANHVFLLNVQLESLTKKWCSQTTDRFYLSLA